MKWDRRKKTAIANDPKPLDLPVDYLRLVESTFTTALEAGLKEIKLIHPTSEFRAGGAIYGDEALLALTLFHGEGNLSATTVYASADFDPMAEKPGIEAILSACLEAAGSVYHFYLDPEAPEKISQLADHSLSALEDGPFDWNQTGDELIRVWVKIDRFNPLLDELTERWLRENDPEYKKSIEMPQTSEEEAFLEERLDAIRKVKAGGSGTPGGSGPITH